MTGRPPRPKAERFWEKVDKSGGTTACWEWLAAKAVGYGRFTSQHGPVLRAHRVAYELAVGPIPDGLELDHLCRNRGCVNPAHLEPVTVAENARRRAEALTHCKRGHVFDDANTYWFGPDKRHRACVECRRLAQSGIAERVTPFRSRLRKGAETI